MMIAHTDMQRRSAAHSTVEKFSLTFLPPAVHRFLFSQSEELVVAHLVLRALFGAVSGTVLYLGVIHNLPPIFNLKLVSGVLFVAGCIIGGALSSTFRCSVLLMFPSMLGSRGHAYLMVFILSVLYKGPVSNMHGNIEAAALSLSCNLDLQVNNSKLLWRDAVRPFMLITQELVDNKAEFESEVLNISRKFQTIRDEVILQYGYDKFKHNTTSGDTTQQQFTAKTMMQCNSVVEEGVQRCADWFRIRWEECMEVVPVPVINHILCFSMKFNFLCDVMKVMTPWCREQIPVEGNFGQFFDQVNTSFDRLSREFRTELVVQEEQQQAVLGEAVIDDFTQTVRESFKNVTTKMEQVLNIFNLLLSFTFITIFTQAFVYLRQYRRDIRFDNIYITTYFRQIDDRRRKSISSGFKAVSVTLLVVILLTIDFSVFHVLDIVSRHSFTQFNLTSGHQVNIRVDGDSMMARLLRKTVSAFNTSSSFHIHTDNQGVYVSCVSLVLLAGLLCCLQVYTNRLRRVIAAFYNPQVHTLKITQSLNRAKQYKYNSLLIKYWTVRMRI
ncbi:E3 ubiquitin-protein ligase DCST1 [Channa argus]|uniref:E3 ubiquitin-protein ligase DCST1 n=1 Tax=Channa argus TaxID=215402 RepID=A0A6G1PQL5_CHAAH|nr:E3 ubiquitin-protein ligase DCST1 [Channa argus]